jgi:DNA polymerase-1
VIPVAKVMLIDGNSLTYRAFFALPTDMATAGGQVTNAAFGFTSMLINLLRDHRPDHVGVAFDLPEPTFRHKRLPTYKANREATPDILRQQMGLVHEITTTLGLPIIETPGFEADDVIATLATGARDDGHEVIVVTGDRDAYQLVEDPSIKVLYNKRGVSDYVLYDEAGIADRTGVTPKDYVNYAALRGDKSDNLPGVPGVGEKTAAKLINKYGGIDGIYANLDEQTPKLQENLRESEDQVRINTELMILVRDVALETGVADLKLGPIDDDEVRKLFDFLEFRSLYERLSEAFDGDVGGGLGGVEVLEAEMEPCADAAEALGILKGLTSSDSPVAMAAAWSGEEGRSPLEGLAVVTGAADGDVAWIGPSIVDSPEFLEGLAALTAKSGLSLAAHGAKPLLRALSSAGVDGAELVVDTMLAAYLLDPAEARYALPELLIRYANRELPDASAAQEGMLDLDGESVDSGQTAARSALAVAWLIDPLLEALDAQGLRQLNDTIEVPLVAVLAKMESIGIGVDVAELEALRDHLTSETDRLRQAVIDDAGEEFNVNSTKQLREILFEKLELTPQKKTKTGYSTDHQSLEKLRDEHPIIEHLLGYREVEKLRSTYGVGLLAEVGPGDRIRATFNQTVARTGRLSSDAPNLHNIPVRTELGREFRKAFVAAPGYELLVADYNQIELRCIAHLAEDPGLITAFEAGDDIHTATASRVFDVDPGGVSIQQRSKAKMVSYGLAYGMEAYGLAQRLNIETGEAQVILDAYFEAFPAVRTYMDATVAEARERGYTETLFGRRRQIPELASSNFRIRQAGERQAMNAGIQGLAADIFKVALVNVDSELNSRPLESRLVLQVHDEVILEVRPEEQTEVTDLVVSCMSGAFDLRVPLEVHLAFGSNWADAKG